MLDSLSTTPDRIVREHERRAITARSRTAWWEDERAGRAPKRLQLGARSVGWRMTDLQAWVRGEWRSTSGTEG
ncbi:MULTISPECIES: helix-turn-helix transcriptional regulator [Aromatoleum]|uniref:AlpA family phage regulatory protein n=1 Tax=Aromatoleum bremense TaxID=76115 RepID=A0ABX1NYU2_9RHOO|nr:MULTISPECIES: AlpA family phage regulatory protein [Aromatoleum]NMG16741.1 AlpA family phage regulatory protein [Aromatoleum bremense]NMG55792.1 AlpA family phage regulatory protein [Aromatoleum aromaticum]QTQ33027.1 Transcriptional activator, AlpA family [Aromatoleum bremense]